MLSAGRARIRHGKPARQAAGGDERETDLGAAATTKRLELGLSQRGKIRLGGAKSRLEVGGRRYNDSAPPDEARALVQERPAARIVRKHENGGLWSEGERDFSRIRPFRSDNEADSLLKDRRFPEIAPFEGLQRRIGNARPCGQSQPRP